MSTEKQPTDDPARLFVRSLCVQRGNVADTLHDISFEVRAGTILAIIGPNGAGKSTLLQAIAGLIPGRGHIAIGSLSLKDSCRREWARQVAYLPQRSHLNAPLDVQNVVSQGRPNYTRWSGLNEADRECVAQAIIHADIQYLIGRRFTELSLGEQRRVLLARALATKAPLLLLDEPSAGLDIRQILTLTKTLKAVAAAGAIVCVVVHPLHEVQDLADRALLLNAGQLVREGAIADVIAPLPIRETYGVKVIPGKSFGYAL